MSRPRVAWLPPKKHDLVYHWDQLDGKTAVYDTAVIVSFVSDQTAITESREQDANSFDALNAAGQPVMLEGRAIRVANASPAELQQVLNAAGIQASLQPVPATIEERMLMLARATDAS